MGHKKVESSGLQLFLSCCIVQNKLPACQTHQFPAKKERQRCVGEHYAYHGEDECNVVHQKVPFSFDVIHIAPGVEYVRNDAENQKK